MTMWGNFFIAFRAAMARVKWESIPESEVRAEVEAVLESQGKAEQIRAFLNDNDDVTRWRSLQRAHRPSRAATLTPLSPLRDPDQGGATDPDTVHESTQRAGE
jgi:hypothetical protein